MVSCGTRRRVDQMMVFRPPSLGFLLNRLKFSGVLAFPQITPTKRQPPITRLHRSRELATSRCCWGAPNEKVPHEKLLRLFRFAMDDFTRRQPRRAMGTRCHCNKFRHPIFHYNLRRFRNFMYQNGFSSRQSVARCRQFLNGSRTALA